MHNSRKSVLVLGIFVLITITCQVSRIRSPKSCPKRTDLDGRCRKECTSSKDCRSTKKRKKACLCDGLCGLSCIRLRRHQCREDRDLVTRLRRGKVLLNGKPYEKTNFKFGDVITYSCKRGFKLTGPSKVTCSGIGKWKPWNKGTPSCRRGCPDPGKPKDGRRFGDSFDVGKRIRFRCNPGYKMIGSPSATCLSTLQWNVRAPKCEVSSCGNPKLPANGRIFRGQQEVYQYGDRVYLSCESGYFRRGSSLIICALNGWRATGSSPALCLPKSCGSPGSPNNGYVEGTLYSYKSIVKFSCKDGYELKGATYRICLQNQRWSGAVPTCEPVDCGVPKDIENGSFKGFGTKFNDNYYAECMNGYILSGSKEITCLADGKWNNQPKCTLVTCDSSYSAIDNGKVIGNDAGAKCTNTYNCRLSFECDVGYYLSDRRLKHSVCEVNGQWTNLKPTCQPVFCGKPDAPWYGMLTEESDNFYYPSTVYYRCNAGYDLVGDSSRNCLETTQWSGALPFCRANCGDPGRPEHGQKYGNIFTQSNYVQFTCDKGYDMIGTARIVCQQSNARWSARKPECRAKDCGDPGFITGGRIITIKPSFKFPSVIRYECGYGYDMDGSNELKCQADGRWSKTPSCTANCGDPGQPENGNKAGSNFKKNGIVRFTCKNGYNLIGSREITCQQKNARWSDSVPTCEPKDCGDPGFITGGRIITIMPSFKFPSVIRYECSYGYDMDGSNELKCQADGRWSKTPSCTANCGDPGQPENGNKAGSNFKKNGVVRFTCENGYNLIGSREITCQQKNARWSDFVPTCEARDCGDPRPISGGRLQGFPLSFKFPSVIQYTCLHGYDMDGLNRVQCQANGQWNRNPSCIANCGYPGKPENGFTFGNNFKKDGVLRFICNNGYNLIGSSKITCQQKNARWSDFVPTCELKDCGDPGSIDGGRIIGNVSSTYGSVVRYECLDGYDMEGQNYTKCLADGSWTKGPKCKGKPCDKPPTLIDGKILDPKQNYSFPDAIKYECNVGFRLAGRSNKVECDRNGNWSKLDAQCNEITCHDPEELEQGKVVPDSIPAMGVDYKFGSKVSFECNRGYKLSGEKTSECLEEGWSGSNRSCSEITCHAPRQVNNGDFEYKESLTSDGKFRLNSEVTYKCNYGYELKGDSTSTCGEDGWSLGQRFCERVTCALPNIANGKIEDDKKVYQVGDQAQVECKTGFDIESGATNMIMCESKNRWSILPKCIAPECRKTFKGFEYRGRVNRTRSGLACQRWDSQKPHLHHNRPSSKSDAALEHNFCRNPDGEAKPWCYTTSLKTRWDFCEIPFCDDGSCDKPLGMKSRYIKEDQITFERSFYKGPWRGRLDGKIWCGKYFNGEVRVTIKFESVVTIASVVFQSNSIHRFFLARKVRFRYFNADDAEAGKWLKTKKIYNINRPTGFEGKVIIDNPIKTSHFEMKLMKGSNIYSYACERFEIFGCQAKAKCNIPQAPENGEALGMIYNEGSQAVYSCKQGYKLKNDDKQTCTVSGKWTGKISPCITDTRQIGCYKNGPYARLFKYIGKDYTPEQCLFQCRRRRYTYAGLQYSYECYCGTNYHRRRIVKIDDGHCNLPCNMDPSRKCGGSYRMSVYSIY